MVPLERLEERKRLKGERERVRVVAPEDPNAGNDLVSIPEEPRAARRFKVIDVLSRQVLAEDVGVAEALQALRGVRSIVDANVYVWEPANEDWRPLRWSERRSLWGLREAA
jgi:hypothetical protein